MDDPDPLLTRRGVKPKPSRGGWLFLLAIGAVVAGLGAAGLHYGKPERWDRPVAASAPATAEPVGTTELTAAERSTAEEVETETPPPSPPEPAASSGAPEPKVGAPSRSPSVRRARPLPARSKPSASAAPEDPFATTH